MEKENVQPLPEGLTGRGQFLILLFPTTSPPKNVWLHFSFLKLFYNLRHLLIPLFYVFVLVACLIAYHLFFMLFLWSYWKTIFTLPMNPSKEVSYNLARLTLLFMLCNTAVCLRALNK